MYVFQTLLGIKPKPVKWLIMINMNTNDTIFDNTLS